MTATISYICIELCCVHAFSPFRVELWFINKGNNHLIYCTSCYFRSFVDVVWLVDVSSSVTASEHELVKTFIYNVTTYLTIGSSDVKMAIVTFDVETNAEFELDDYDAKDELLSAIDAIPEKSNPVSGRKTMDALTYTKHYFCLSKVAVTTPRKLLLLL